MKPLKSNAEKDVKKHRNHRGERGEWQALSGCHTEKNKKALQRSYLINLIAE